MKYNFNEKWEMKTLHHALGWDDNVSTQDLVSICLILCSEIERLQDKIMEMDKSLYQAANTASCLANGIISD